MSRQRPMAPARLKLAQLPTPLEEYAVLRTGLWVKRDDLTGNELSGNKVRKLEFLVADALAHGCDTLITAGAVQSNHARCTAAVAARLGLRCHLVLSGEASELSWKTGNALLDRLFGAHIVHVPEDADLIPTMQRVANELRDRGLTPYVIPIGGSSPLAAWGYIEAVRELKTQITQLGLKIHRVLCAAGSCGTLVGLACGAWLERWDVRVTGISISSTLERKQAFLQRSIRETCDYLGIPFDDVWPLVELYDYAGAGYARSVPEEVQFIARVAACSGLVLDPVYTGKALFGFFDLCRQGFVRPEENVVFFHTGGLPGLLAMGPEIAEWLPESPGTGEANART